MLVTSFDVDPIWSAQRANDNHTIWLMNINKVPFTSVHSADITKTDGHTNQISIRFQSSHKTWHKWHHKCCFLLGCAICIIYNIIIVCITMHKLTLGTHLKTQWISAWLHILNSTINKIILGAILSDTILSVFTPFQETNWIPKKPTAEALRVRVLLLHI